MKKLYLLLALSAISMLGYSAEKPTENKNTFVTEGKIWNVLYSENNYFTYEFSYALNGDTLLDGKQYKKFYALSDSTLIEPRRNKDYLLGGFREVNQKVWFIPIYGHEAGIEVLMYDFSAKVGDFVEIGCYSVLHDMPGFASDTPYEATTEILDIWTDNNGRRHFNVNSFRDTEWIEGIGGNTGLFWTCFIDILDGKSRQTQLGCVKKQESIVYMNNPYCDRCFCNDVTNVVVGLQPAPASKAEIALSPNPVSEQLNITIADEAVPCVINLYSTTGEYVTGKRLTKAQDQMSMTGVDAGLYLYRIATDGGELLDAGKVIKE